MEKNAFVAWRVHPKPWTIERTYLRQMSCPLNITDNARHPFCLALKKMRSAAIQRALKMPIADERSPTRKIKQSNPIASADPANLPVVLISCAKSKQRYRCAAKELYCSTLFKCQRTFAEACSNRWFVLSAKHWLLRPDQQIRPYEKTLNGASVAEKKDWAKKVFARLDKKLKRSDRIIITAGENYCRYLVPLLEARGHKVDRPLRGITMGFQPARLRELARELGPQR